MIRRIAEITRSAYKQALELGIEPYKKEALGIITGYKSRIYHIQGIFPIQTAKRKFSNVESKYYKEERIAKIEKIFNKFILGDIHSHTDFHNSKVIKGESEIDNSWLKENPEKFSLILFLERIQRISSWRGDNMEIVSYISIDKEDIKLKTTLKGYYYDLDRKRYMKIDLRPSKDLMNKLEEEIVN